MPPRGAPDERGQVASYPSDIRFEPILSTSLTRLAGPTLLVLIPIYDDWEAVTLLLALLDAVLADAGMKASILLVDDGSVVPASRAIGARLYTAIDAVDVLALRQNVGHQRAIAIALAYVHDRLGPGATVVMDGDGEDAPRDVPRLVIRMHELGDSAIVFAERRRRSEQFGFRVFYGLYRILHLLLTGIPVRVGNFSVVPASLLARVVVVSELWNHYAAAVFKARLPRNTVPTERARRLCGETRMNFVALVAHGLSALSVHAEVIGVRLLVATGLLVGAICAVLASVLFIRLATTVTIPGWAPTAVGLLVILLVQAIALALFFVLLIMHGRTQPLFIPIRDYHVFVNPVARLFPTAAATAPAAATRPR
jgi:polyisoprenyl-phosphate glycosyltransferase